MPDPHPNFLSFQNLGHRHWVLVTAWSPDGERLASACKGGHIIIWDPTTGKQVD